MKYAEIPAQTACRNGSDVSIEVADQVLYLVIDDLHELTYKPGQDLVLAMPLGDGTTGRRHYTIRRFDPAAKRLDIDFVLHGDSPSGNWARTVRPGDRIEAMGPWGKRA